jgi:acetyl esterase/lipase
MTTPVQSRIVRLIARAGELGFDPNNIYIGGWSAGGHLRR